jgi:Uma2 family endonuclease
MGMPATSGWTIEEYRKLPEDDGNRYEIIDGELFVTPAPTWRHQDAVTELTVRLRHYLGVQPIGWPVQSPADVEFGFRTVVEPDLFVVPLVDGRRPRNFEEAGRLLLAVEVLSPGTSARDRGIKRQLYQRERVSDYWIVDGDAELFEIWRPAEDRPEIAIEQLRWLPEGATEPFALDVREFFGSLIER